MALVIQALILCATDDPEAADAAVFQALNGAAFDSESPILDFEHGVQQKVAISPDNEEGMLVSLVPAVRYLRTANPVTLPC